MDARIKHHKLFYAGGDVSHQAFIDNLSKQKVVLEEKLLRIDERAYEVGCLQVTINKSGLNIMVLQLLKQTEKAGWLDHHVPLDPVCEDVLPLPESKLSLETTPPSPSLSASDTSYADIVSPSIQDSNEELFSDLDSDSASSNSCQSACCEKITARPLTYRSRVLAYLDFPDYFAEEEDKSYAIRYMNNIFRYTISRVPSLLVRARTAACPSVTCFLERQDLQEAEFGRLWRALKYNNVHAEGKLSVNAVRNALCDAEYEDEERKGPCIDLLGGKVWKDALQHDLSRRGWDHFYRFVSLFQSVLGKRRKLMTSMIVRQTAPVALSL